MTDAFYAAFNSRDLDTWISFLDEDVEIVVDGGTLRGRAGARIYVDGILRTYPGVEAASRRVVAESGDCVVSEFHLRNPARVPPPGSRADGAPWRLEGMVCEVVTVVRGRIVTLRSYYAPTADDRTAAAQVPSRAEAARIAGSHAALRRVAAHVAGGVPEQELFAVVNAAIAELTAADLAVLLRYEPGDVVTSLAVWNPADVPLPAGDRSPADATVRAVRDTGEAARFGPDGPQPWGAFLHAARRARIRTSIAVPVVLDGQVWGVSVSGVVREEPLPDDTEAAVEAFAGIVSTALATARADGELRRRAREQSELRQVAEIAARGDDPAEVFTAVARGASRLLGGSPTSLLRAEDDGTWVIVADRNGHAPVGARIPGTGGSLTAQVRRTGRAARIDDYTGVPGASQASEFGLRAAVGVPVVVEGRLWGMITASSSDLPLPADTERRLSQFAELVSAAVSSAQARGALREVADEQAALRRVAELAAGGADQQELFAAVAREAARLVQEHTVLARMDGDRTYTLVAVQGGPAPVGTRVLVPPGDQGVVAEIMRTHRPARLDDYGDRRGRAYAHDDYGVRSSVAVPIVVDDRLWGVLGAISSGRPVAPGVERRLAQFAELAAAALANVQARADLQQLADEQTALRAVAELVARAAPPQHVFDAVATEASQLLGGTATTLTRFEGADVLVVVSAHHGPTPIDTRIVYEPGTLPERVRTSSRPVRVDDYAGERDAALAARFGLAAAVAVPVVVAGEVWGMLTATAPAGPLRAGTEDRLEQFAGLVGTAIFAAQARRDLRSLAEEQAALRRVAEAVAGGAGLDEVFAAVATEASRLLGDVAAAALMRYDPGDVAVVVAAHRSPAPLGLRVPSDGDTGTGIVLRTGKPVRIDSFEGTALEVMARELGVAAGVAVPVTVEGRVWGTLTTSSPRGPLPAGTEERLTHFARLAAAAIANAENRAKLTASRARVVAAGDESRRRLQRDVHDSAQQRLVHAVITLKLARDAIGAGQDASALVDEALKNAERAGRDLRDVVRGILPAALTAGGLRAGLESLVHDVALPVDLRVAVPRLPAALETTAYFVVAEALTNVVKHARAARAVVDVSTDGHHLVVDVRDDGVGGADPSRGSGLTGLLDRVEANDGSLTITSPPGRGTAVHARIPVRA